MVHGTTSDFPDWYIRFQQAVLSALPRPSELDQATALEWANRKTGAMREGFLFLVSQTSPLPIATPAFVPLEGEEFELTLESSVDPMEMIRNDGFDAGGWDFRGLQVRPPLTRRFKLVQVGPCHTLGEVRARIVQHGDIPEGQWREVFKRIYTQTDGGNPIGFPDASWLDAGGSTPFPALEGKRSGRMWRSHFRWDTHIRRGTWRWLVAVKE